MRHQQNGLYLPVTRHFSAPTLSNEQLEGLSPTAAAASSLIKKGMTLSQVRHSTTQSSRGIFRT